MSMIDAMWDSWLHHHPTTPENAEIIKQLDNAEITSVEEWLDEPEVAPTPRSWEEAKDIIKIKEGIS